MSIAQKILEKTSTKTVKASSKSEATTKFDSYVRVDATSIDVTLHTDTGLREAVLDLVMRHIKPDYSKEGKELINLNAKASSVAKSLEKKLSKEIEALEADFQKKVLQKIEAAAKELGAVWK